MPGRENALDKGRRAIDREAKANLAQDDDSVMHEVILMRFTDADGCVFTLKDFRAQAERAQSQATKQGGKQAQAQAERMDHLRKR